MAYESDSVTRRTIGPALASTVVGVVLGIVAVIGVAALAHYTPGQTRFP